jgi:sulfur carrier protein ThiS
VEVTVTRKGVLAGGHGTYDETVVVGDGARASDLLAACGIAPGACIVVVNGVAVGRSTPLHDGDRAQLYAAQAGG